MTTNRDQEVSREAPGAIDENSYRLAWEGRKLIQGAQLGVVEGETTIHC